MKKIAKFLFFAGLATVALLLGIVLIAAFSPGLQKRLVLGVLEDATAATPRLESVRIGLSRAEIHGFELSAGREHLRLATLEVRYAAWSLVRRRPRIEEMILTGLEIDVAAEGGAALQEAFRTGTRNRSSAGQEPAGLPVTLGKVRLDGLLRLPDNRSYDFDLKVDNIRPGGAGAAEFKASQSSEAASADFEQAEAIVTLAVHQTVDGIFDRVGGSVLLRLLELRSTQWVEARMTPRFEAGAGEFEFLVESLTVKKGPGSLGEGSLEAKGRRDDVGRWRIDYAARLGADLAAIARLSAVRQTEPLASGLMKTDLQGVLWAGERFEARGTLELNELRPPRYTGRALAIRLEPRIDGEVALGTLNATTPIRLVGPSSVTTGTLSAALKAGQATRQHFDLEAVLDVFSFDEWAPLISSLSAEDAEAPADGVPDTRPPWADFEGQAVARLGRLEAGGQSLTDVQARILVADDRDLRIELQAKRGSTPLTATTVIAFQSRNPNRPYAMTGNLELKGLDVTPFLKPEEGSQPPILEGAFDAQGSFQATAPTLPALADGLTGQFQLRSAGKGIVRPLGARTSLAEGISGILGAVAGNVREVGWAQEVFTQLKEIPYTQLTLEIERDAQFNLVMQHFDLISRETRLQGSGRVSFAPDLPLLRRPLEMRFDLSAKGRLADALRAGQQLRSEEPDALGFLPGPPLPLRGSLAKPESLLVNLLRDASQQFLPNLLLPKTIPPKRGG